MTAIQNSRYAMIFILNVYNFTGFALTLKGNPSFNILTQDFLILMSTLVRILLKCYVI